MLFYTQMISDSKMRSLFEQIYRTYRVFLWQIAASILKDPYLAEDAVHETFILLTSHMDAIEDPLSNRTKAYLATMIKHKSLDLLRKRNRQEESTDELPEIPGPDLLDSYVNKASAEALVRAIRRLPEDYRVIMEYRYLHELDDKEISRLLDISPVLTRVRLSRARNRLKQILEEGGEKI